MTRHLCAVTIDPESALSARQEAEHQGQEPPLEPGPPKYKSSLSDQRLRAGQYHCDVVLQAPRRKASGIGQPLCSHIEGASKSQALDPFDGHVFEQAVSAEKQSAGHWSWPEGQGFSSPRAE